jgi:hypothetical protein
MLCSMVGRHADALSIIVPPPAATIEYVAGTCTLLIHGTITQVATTGPADRLSGNVEEILTVKVREYLKGAGPDQLIVKVSHRWHDHPFGDWRKNGTPLLLALKRVSTPGSGWVLCRLEPWYRSSGTYLAFPLDGSAKRLYDLKLHPLTSGEEILLAARAAGRADVSECATLSFDSRIIVPIDERLEAGARALITSTRSAERHFAVSALALFRNPSNQAILLNALADPYCVCPGSDRVFITRQVAVNTLKRWNVDFEMPVLSEALVRPGVPVWSWLFLALSTGVLWRIGRRLRRIERLPESRHRRALCHVLTVVLTLGAVLVFLTAGLAWRLASKPEDIWLVDDFRKVQCIRSRWGVGSAMAPGAEWPALPLVRVLANEVNVFPRAALGFNLNFGRIDIGHDQAQWIGAFYIAVPWWAIAIALALWPASRGWAMVAEDLRRRRERGKGHCPVCGYDLRAHGPGDKCPECGTPVQRANSDDTPLEWRLPKPSSADAPEEPSMEPRRNGP